MKDHEMLLSLLSRGMPDHERLILCGFRGDPNTAGAQNWRPRPWRPGSEMPFDQKDNAYVAVSSFLRAGDGSFRRRGDTFAAGRALMVDDVGTKVDRAIVGNVTPTLKVETSPGNEQWWYILDKPELDAPRFDGLIRAFITAKLLGADPGMSGVTRVGRLPGFANGKAKYGGFTTRTVECSGKLWSQDSLLRSFGLNINGRREIRPKLQTEVAIERNRAFTTVYKWLLRHGMLKKKEPDPSGWMEMHCPWVGDHTDKADTGAAIREPAPENDYYGGFRCHHGHCADKGWAELTEWIGERAAEALEEAAKNHTFDEIQA